VGVLIGFLLFAVENASCKEAYHLKAKSGNYRKNFGRILEHI
jgi:hypothetical protein